MNASLDSLLKCAIAAARAAGKHASANRSRRREIVHTYAHDVKLKLDGECQKKAEKIICTTFPGHSILGEEDFNSTATAMDLRLSFRGGAMSARDGLGPVQWIIDPIDGTVNFTHGVRLWCSSVAACVNGRVVAGAVYAPDLDELYVAASDRLATCNGKAIRVSGVAKLADAMVATGQDRGVIPGLPPFELLTVIGANAQKARVMGSAALDLCQVARGAMDGYFEAGIYVWDIAAAGLIVCRAGGKAELLARLAAGRLCFLATNGHIHAEMKKLLAPSLASVQ